MAAPDTPPEILASPDFFTVSSCRDLLFHVDEHPVRLSAIAAFTAAHGLTFIGFDVDHRTLVRYAERHPEDKTRTNLALWQEFEEKDNDLFAGMYQFWVQKT